MSDRTPTELAALAEKMRPTSDAYLIADLLVPDDLARGTPRIWAHLWLEAYRIGIGHPHERGPFA